VAVSSITNRQRLFRLQTYFPERNESQLFDDALHRLQHERAHRFLAWFDNGSMQRAVFWLFFVALVFSMLPLMELDMTIGARPQIPIDFVMIAGATLLCVSSVATVHLAPPAADSDPAALRGGHGGGHCLCPVFGTRFGIDPVVCRSGHHCPALLALHFLPQRIRNFSSPNRIIRDASLAVLIGGVVGTITFALITRPLESISGYFIDNAKALGGGTNIVNVILVDFRGFDTFGEISVLAIAALGIGILVEHMRPIQSDADTDGLRWASDKHPMMLSVISQALLPLAMMVSVYIFMRGHNLPGGGFIAGLITSVAMIQQYIAQGYGWMKARLSINYLHLIGSGLLIAAATGIGSFIWQQPFLKSWHGHLQVPFWVRSSWPVRWRSIWVFTSPLSALA
jgi:multicomponent K+:H+ antiporter subunit A